MIFASVTVVFSVGLYFLLFKINAAKYLMKRFYEYDGFYYVAACSMPSIFLFDLYNRNRVGNHIIFSHVLIIAVVLAVIGTALFLLFKLAAKSREGALILCILFWVAFWVFESVFDTLVSVFPSFTPIMLIVLLLLVLLSLTAILRKFRLSFPESKFVFNVLALAMTGLFMFNLYPGVHHEFTLNRERAVRSEYDEREFYIKHNFLVDESLPSPDIYWFHMDSLLSLETMERFWGESQEDLRYELSNRGFLIYAEGTLGAAKTQEGIIALLSPSLYDNYLSYIFRETQDLIEQHDEALGEQWFSEIHRPQMELDGINLFADIMPYHELLNALLQRGYDLFGLPHWISDHFAVERNGYVSADSFINRFLVTDLPILLNLTTPLTIPTNPISTHVQTSATSSYSFIWRTCMRAHTSHFWHYDPSLPEYPDPEIPLRYDLYPLAFNDAVVNMLAAIDEILDYNPDAVIVLQADHGLHYSYTHSKLLMDGYSIEQVLELAFSVFSAVRIPEKYGGLDAPLDPRNIARELVNRFVGQNYELLPQR